MSDEQIPNPISPTTPIPGSFSKASRVQVGLAVAILFFGAAIAGGWAWSLVITLSVLIGQQEMYTLLAGINVRPSKAIIWLSTLLMMLMASLNLPQFLSPLLTLAVIASFFRLLFRSPRAGINDIGGTLLVVFYMVYMPAHFVLVRHLAGDFPQFAGLAPWQQPGMHFVFLTMAVISSSDIAGYYIGSRYGKHLLYPAISPKKTREGAIAGLVAGCAFGVGSTFIWPFIPWPHALVLSILLVIVGQLGDLAESMMKRDAGLKDSGNLLASHGGFLDRADGYIFSGAVCYYYIYWVIYHQGLAEEVIEWFGRFTR